MLCPNCSSTNSNTKPGSAYVTKAGAACRKRHCKNCHCEFRTEQQKGGDEVVVEVTQTAEDHAAKTLDGRRRGLIMGALWDIKLMGKFGREVLADAEAISRDKKG